MQEKIFRGKSIAHHGKKEEWVYGFYSNYKGVNGRTHYISDDNGRSVAVQPETVGQYTGLTDKNGRKVFEGDIVEYQYVICEEDGVGVYVNSVTFENGCFCIDGDSDFTLSYAIWSSDEYGGLTVIGNIHDNPKLLN